MSYINVSMNVIQYLTKLSKDVTASSGQKLNRHILGKREIILKQTLNFTMQLFTVTY